MNDHPIELKYRIKNFIYSHGIFSILSYFFLFLILISVLYIILYLELSSNIELYTLAKFSIYTSFGFSIKDLNITGTYFEITYFTQQFISMLVKLIFTSIIVIKFFAKPIFFQFKEKINLDEKILTISFYNKTNFSINSCNLTVYARLPYLDKHKVNCLNNIKLHPEKDYFPFMDKHLVTRINIDLNKDINRTDFTSEHKNIGLLEIFDKPKEEKTKQQLRITVILEAICPEIDGNIYEIYNYDININSKKGIEQLLTKKAPHSIDIDELDFTKSKNWEKFED